jgi:hypothetical protein
MLAAQCYDTPIWYVVIWSAQDRVLPFFQKADIPTVQTGISELIIDNIYYGSVSSLQDLYSTQNAFWYDSANGLCYFHNANHNPAWLYYLPKYNIIYGFTTGQQRKIGDILYSAGALSLPQVKTTADDLEYAQMKFKTGSFTLPNTKGEYDEAADFLGNEFALKHLMPGASTPVEDFVYYVKDIKLKLESASLTLGDKRERLGYKVANEYYTQTDYPDAEETSNGQPMESGYNSGNVWGTVKQDVYGWCKNIPAVCVDAAAIYQSGSSGALKTTRTFRVARKITQITSIEVKMTQPDDSEVSGQTKEVWTDQWKLHQSQISVDYANGTFTMPISLCMPATAADGSGWPSSDDVPDVYDVRVTGNFHPGYVVSGVTGSTALAVMLELFRYYAQTDWNAANATVFNKTGLLAELAPLSQKIGVMWDSETDLYQAIESLQSGCVKGWQFLTDGQGRFTARVDNNNRAAWGDITSLDITNLDEVEIDMNTDNYATRINIAYQNDYNSDADDPYLHVINDTYREDILGIFHIDKTYPSNSDGDAGGLQTLLYNKADAETKASLLADYFSKLRQTISGIKLFGEKWLDLKIYDIVNVDLTQTYNRTTIAQRYVTIGRAKSEQIVNADIDRRYTIALRRQNTITRKFGGVIRCKVMSTNIDLKNCVNTVSLLFVG